MIDLISLILLLLPSYLLRFSIFGIPTTLLEILIYLVFIYGLWQAKKTKFRPIPIKIWLPIIVLIISLIISTIVAPDKKTALGEFRGFFIDPLLIFWLVYQFIKKEDCPKMFWALIFSGTFVATHTIIQKILGHVTTDGRVIGIFGYSPNYIALFLAPIAVLLIASIVYSSREALAESRSSRQARTIINNYKNIFLIFLLVILNIVAIYFSGSRGGILAFAAGIGAFVTFYYWQWIRQRISSQIIVAILIAMAIYTSWVLFRPDFSVSPETGGRIATSNNLRWQIWQTSIELARKQPILGVGLGNFQPAFDELTKTRANFPEYITPMALTPHNIFLMFYLETGLLGLVAFLWLLITFIREAIKKLPLKYTAIILAVMLSIIFYGLVESSIWKNDLSIIFWAMWGLVWAEENANLKMQKSK